MKLCKVSPVAVARSGGLLLMLMSGAAAAQALNLGGGTDAVGQQAITVLSQVGSWLQYLGLAVVTIAVLVQGYKVMFKQHRWGDVGHVLLGAAFIGGAGTLAGIFMKIWG